MISDFLALYKRALELLKSSPASLQFTGVLGLAILLYGWYHGRARGPTGGGQPPQPSGATAEQQLSQGPSNIPPSAGVVCATPAKPPAQSKSKHASAVSRQLQGIKRVTISIDGVVVQQDKPFEYSSIPDAVRCVQEVAKVADVYLLAQVSDDVQQALMCGALEACGVLGNAAAQVRPHRLLFCSTLEGKTAIVRQLESELHVDARTATVHELKRFIPQLLHVRSTAATAEGSASSAPNVGSAPSLAAFFGLAQ